MYNVLVSLLYLPAVSSLLTEKIYCTEVLLRNCSLTHSLTHSDAGVALNNKEVTNITTQLQPAGMKCEYILQQP